MLKCLRFILWVACFATIENLFGQFGSVNMGDGQILASDYANHEYNKDGTTYRMAWDDNNLYLAASANANFSFGQDALNIYIDTHNDIPVNGSSATGNDNGLLFDNITTKLPFRGDYFGFIESNYDTRRQAYTGAWDVVSSPNDDTYTVQNGADWIEVAIPWDDINNGLGRPASFNFLMYISFNGGGGGRIRSIPFPNSNDSNSNPNDYFYFRVTNTASPGEGSPFEKVCFTQHVSGNYDYNNTLPNPLYDATVHPGSGQSGEARLFLNDDLTLSHDLVVYTNGRLQPGSGQVHTLTMTGAFPNTGSIYNYGNIETIPDIWNTTGEKLLFVFAGNTILRSNGGLGASQTKFSDITVNSGATLDADAAGLLDAELQFGTLINNGTFDMVGGLTGFVNWTLRGVAGNTYAIDPVGNAPIFHRLIIGTGATLANGGSTPLSLNIREDFELLGTFEHDNGLGGLINLVFGSVEGVDQTIKTFDSNPVDPVQFAGLEIASGGDVRFLHVGSTAPTFEIEESLTLTSGRLFTIDESVPNNPIRYTLVVKDGATINTPGVTSGYTTPPTDPCFLDGPLSIELTNSGTAFFPVGKGQNYRPMGYVFNADPGTFVFTSEHFHESAEAFNLPFPSSPESILNVSEIRYWNLFVSPVPLSISSESITLSYGDLDDTDGVTSDADLRIVYGEFENFGGPWANISPGLGGSAGQIASSVSFGFPFGPGVSHYFTLGNTQAGVNPLPVTWLSFTGRAAESVNQLEWSTGSEQNNDYFEVQRSKDGALFEPIGQVQGQGTTNVPSDYAFTDDETPKGTVYYRLQQFDFNGDSDFSETVAITRKGNAGIYPNPFKDSFNIAWEGSPDGAPAAFTIFDATGRKMAEHAVNPPVHTIATENLPNGSYFGELRVKGSPPMVFKLVK